VQTATPPRVRQGQHIQARRQPPTSSTRLPDHWLPRGRLHTRLEEATERKVTIVTGPPGSGKTSLVAGWAMRRRPDKTFWLPSAQPLARLSNLIACSSRDGIGSEDSAPTVLIIDDLQSISERRVAAELERLVAQLAPGVRLVLIGRHCGAVSISHLCLMTEVAEIGGRELEFTSQEADALLRQSGLDPESESIRQLVGQTRGWAAGLRLAAVSMSDIRDPRAAAANLNVVGGPIWDYFETEVLSQLPPADIDALVRASVSGSFHFDFFEAVTGRTDSAQLLESLVARNLFVSKAQSETYTWHPMLAAHLRERLAMQDHKVVTDAHSRAAEWFETRNYDEEAMHQYALADRLDRSVRIGAADLVGALTSGSLVPRCLLPGEIPESYFAADPSRAYLRCASLMWASQYDEAARQLSRLEITLDGRPGLDHQKARAEWLWAIYDSAVLDADGALTHFEAAKHLLANGISATAESDPPWLTQLDNAQLSLLPWMVARSLALVGRADAARQFLDQHGHSHRPPLGALGLGPSASVALAGGRLREAMALARRGIEMAETSQEAPALLVECRIALAGALGEQDELGAARTEFSKARTTAARANLDSWVALVDCEIARLNLSEGNAQRALHQLQAIRQAENNSCLPASLLSKVDSLEFHCRLALGDVDGARFILNRIPPEGGLAEGLTRLHLCAGRPDKAAVELGRSCLHPSSLRAQIERGLLQARVNLLLGNPVAAEHALERAVDTGRPERFMRVFLEEPTQIWEALRSIRSFGPDHYIEELLERVGADKTKSSNLVRILEPLTERERELVAFLPSHLTQSEIGRRMYISSNTVKTHMKGLYRKLGATSRSEAVDLARGCGLL
jgi:LuxR family transcriptional regulator, maltose regulon positive regulatory protein